jgi:hypothetical protein
MVCYTQRGDIGVVGSVKNGVAKVEDSGELWLNFLGGGRNGRRNEEEHQQEEKNWVRHGRNSCLGSTPQLLLIF